MNREAQLANYWVAAAIPHRHFDDELAKICYHKAEYWVNPDNYDCEGVVKLGIELNEVRAAYRKMLLPVNYRTKITVHTNSNR